MSTPSSPPPGGAGTQLHPRRGRAAALLAVATASLALLALSPGFSRGQSLESIQSRIHSTRGKLEHVRGKEQVFTSDIASISRRIRSLESEVAGLRNRQTRIEGTLDARRAELARTKSRYEREQARYMRLKRRLRRAQAVLAKRLVAIYKSDQPDFVTVILESDGFNDLLERADYLSRIGEQDSVIVDRVRELEQASSRKRALLGELKRRAQDAVDAIEARQRELASARAAVETRQGALASARRQKRGALAGVQVSRSKLEGQLASLEAASVQVTAQLRGSAGVRLPAGPLRRGSSGFIWPVSGPVVSSFGQRWGRLHAGVDIVAPGGTPIRAAASGRVAIAGWQGGYGQYTCIQQGGGIATCYAHQSSIGVGVGQSVRQGQVIGAVGCTGHCFGDHLHFEVRVNGTPVDPMGYL